jgi:2'-5' RNA ligase
MQNVRYDYSSAHIEVPELIAQDVRDWGIAQVSDDDLFVTQRDPTFGREDEIHITVLYGIHSELSEQVEKTVKDFGPIRVRLGKIDVFTNPPKFDVVMIEAESEQLKSLNQKLEDNVRHTSKYPVYSPHVTIAYVKKGKGKKYRGINLWERKEFTCNYVVFSSKNGTKERIPV